MHLKAGRFVLNGGIHCQNMEKCLVQPTFQYLLS